MYLELGWLPVRFIVQSRRQNFLKYKLNQSESTLVKQVFNEQKKNPKKGDWIKNVESDLKKLKITLSYEDISSMTKASFKKLVKETTEKCALKYLKVHIKLNGKEIKYNEIKMKNYLTSISILTLQEKKEVFKIRTRMTEVKCNFRKKYDNLNCDIFEKYDQYKEETQEHVYNCTESNENKEIFELILNDTHETKTLKEIKKNILHNMKEKEKKTSCK